MKPTSDQLIDELVKDLAPVRPIRLVHGILLVALATLVTMLLVEGMDGLRRDVLAGHASDFFFVTNGMLALVGAASAFAVVRMVNPRVGISHEGARWSAAMLGLLPATALLMSGFASLHNELANDHSGLECFVAGTGLGLLTAGTLVLWLRRGAPVSLNAAGLLTGIASGAIGSFVSGMACPVETVGHLGVWHVAPVAISAIAGRLIIPQLLRW